mmetsp:Transcript_109884/g.342518  ORF Transcript_109884/g.342518 Transcript_109884/m.342518 type:complete len:340 (-) Transcript_109884:132-1151(-)
MGELVPLVAKHIAIPLLRELLQRELQLTAVPLDVVVLCALHEAVQPERTQPKTAEGLVQKCRVVDAPGEALLHQPCQLRMVSRQHSLLEGGQEEEHVHHAVDHYGLPRVLESLPQPRQARRPEGQVLVRGGGAGGVRAREPPHVVLADDLPQPLHPRAKVQTALALRPQARGLAEEGGAARLRVQPQHRLQEVVPAAGGAGGQGHLLAANVAHPLVDPSIQVHVLADKLKGSELAEECPLRSHHNAKARQLVLRAADGDAKLNWSVTLNYPATLLQPLHGLVGVAVGLARRRHARELQVHGQKLRLQQSQPNDIQGQVEVVCLHLHAAWESHKRRGGRC